MKQTALLLLTALCAFNVFSQGPVAAYTFNGNANDVSGNGHNGTLESYNSSSITVLPQLTTGHDGAANSAYFLPDSNPAVSRIDFGQPAALDFDTTQSFTVCLWFKYKGTPFTPAMISNIGAAWGKGILLSLYNSGGSYRPKFTMGSPQGFQLYAVDLMTGYVVSPDTWYHYTVVVDRSAKRVRCYLNGTKRDVFKTGVATAGTVVGNNEELDITGANVTASPSADLQIGMSGNYPSTHFTDGTVDDVYFFDRALSDQEVADVYAGNIPGGNPAAPAAPSNLSLTVFKTESTNIRLNWTDNANNEQGFKIERSTDGNNFTEIGTAGVDGNMYEDLSLTPSTQYYYRVLAYNGTGSSAPSNVAQAGTGTGIADAGDLGVSLWPNPASGFIQAISQVQAISFRIYDASGRLLLQTGETRLDIAGLAPGIYICKIELADGTVGQAKVYKQ